MALLVTLKLRWCGVANICHLDNMGCWLALGWTGFVGRFLTAFGMTRVFGIARFARSQSVIPTEQRDEGSLLIAVNYLKNAGGLGKVATSTGSC